MESLAPWGVRRPNKKSMREGSRPIGTITLGTNLPTRGNSAVFALVGSKVPKKKNKNHYFQRGRFLSHVICKFACGVFLGL